MTDEAVNPSNPGSPRENPTGMVTPPELESSLGPLIHDRHQS